MDGRFWISVVALFVVSMTIGFIVHGFLLHGDYALLPSLMRTETDAQGHFLWMVVAHVLMAFGLTWIYRQGRESDRPWPGQGLRFGLAMAVVMTVPMYLIYYAVQPWPGSIVVKQIGFDTVGMLILGLVTAAVNNTRRTA
jgi:membrane protease YdiL (CAAX protease family)